MSTLGGVRWITCRSSSSFVTDDPSDSYSIGETGARTLTLAGGTVLSHHWTSDAIGSAQNSSSSGDTRLAGVISNPGTFQLVVDGFTAGHAYRMKYAGGYPGLTANVGFRMYQGIGTGGATVQDVTSPGSPVDIAYAASVEGDHLIDAVGFEHSSYASWLTAGGSSATFVPTGTAVTFFRYDSGTPQQIRAVGFVEVTTGRKSQLTTTFAGKIA